MPHRRVIILVLLGLAGLATIGAQRSCRGRAPAAPPSTAAPSVAAPPPVGRVRDARGHGRITGRVTDHGGAPLAAQVCATWWADGLGTEQTRAPICAPAAAGQYALADLADGDYEIFATAPRHATATWHDADGATVVRLRDGQPRAGIDLALDDGAVQVAGIVVDVNGGPIADAIVMAGPRARPELVSGFARTADDGRFVLWTRPGMIEVRASADGYGDGAQVAIAPGAFVEVLLTPESVLAGTVVEAGSHAPVAGAEVEVADQGDDARPSAMVGSTVTDAAGHFRITRLPPGRYRPSAHRAGARGEIAAAVRVGLGETVDGLEIPLLAMPGVHGRIVLAAHGDRPCPDGFVRLRSDAGYDLDAAADPNGEVAIDAIWPGTYEVIVFCAGHDPIWTPDALRIGTTDLRDVRWVAGADGGTIAGHVRTRSGAPVAGATLIATATRTGFGTTDATGAFTIGDLAPATYALSTLILEAHAPPAPRSVDVRAGTTATVDLVVDDGGTIAGKVVDGTGAPVRAATVRARTSLGAPSTLTADDGTFTLRGVTAGAARVTAAIAGRTLHGPAAAAEPGAMVTVTDGQTTTVTLVVIDQRGAITGEVVDAHGAPVADAIVTAAAEAVITSGDDIDPDSAARRPVVTAVDGAFTIAGLELGAYTVRATRRGGGVAVAAHVAVGSHAHLAMGAAGVLGGTVTLDGQPVALCSIAIAGRTTQVVRSDRFASPDGHFEIGELPPDTYAIDVTAAGARGTAQATLPVGQDRTDLQIALASTLTVRGRVIEAISGAPVAGIEVSLAPVDAAPELAMVHPGGVATTGPDGRFEAPHIQRGALMLVGHPTDLTAPFAWIMHRIDLPATGDAVDLGDTLIVRRRVQPNAPVGDLGFGFTSDRDPSLGVISTTVATVVAGGPAARAGLAPGEVVIAIDGVDVRGRAHDLLRALLQVPPGAAVVLGLARGDLRVVAR
jgi:protocatechuate 3,4-dioxygenase beta subunit